MEEEYEVVPGFCSCCGFPSKVTFQGVEYCGICAKAHGIDMPEEATTSAAELFNLYGG